MILVIPGELNDPRRKNKNKKIKKQSKHLAIVGIGESAQA